MRALVPLAALLVLTAACSKAPQSDRDAAKNAGVAQEAEVHKEATSDSTHVTGTGTVVRSELEGGFYAIRSDDGVTYDPQSLPDEFKTDGLRVKFTVRGLPDAIGIHQVGPIVEVIEITRLE